MFVDEQLREWPALRERCLQGDQTAWSQFDHWVRPRLSATLRRKLGRRVDPDDLVQAVLIRLWKDDQKRFRRLDARRHPMPFLVRVGVRLHLDRLRAQGRRPEQRRSGTQRRFVVSHAAVLVERVADYRLIPRVVDAALDEFMETLTAKNQDVLVRVVLHVAAEEPAGGTAEAEHGPGGGSAGEAANGARRASKTEQRMVERMAGRFRELVSCA